MKSARLLLVLVLSSLASFAGTLRVPQDFPTVQDAVAASVAGDSIVISPGLYAIPAAPCTLANGSQHTCGLVLHDGTTLVGLGPAQTVLDFSGADVGILLQLATATVKLLHLRNAATAIYAYVGSNITVTNVIITDLTGPSVLGMELNQGNSYTIHNNTIDNIHQPNDPVGTAIDVPFGGVSDIQNNLLTNNTHGVTAGSFFGGTYAYNDVFGSLIADWSTCDESGCTPVSAPPGNISADPLYCPDLTLQPGSPARNAGNPAILNSDGTRSDMGAYGGPEEISPPLLASQCVVDFGSVQIGTTSSPVNIQLQSTLGVSQTVNTITTDNSQFTISSAPPLPATVAPNGTLGFSARFSPSAPGAISAKVQIATSNSFPTSIIMTGLGAVPSGPSRIIVVLFKGFNLPDFVNGIPLPNFSFDGMDILLQKLNATFGTRVLRGNVFDALRTQTVHLPAQQFILSQNPQSQDKIVVIGHSHGGNRARLFASQLLSKGIHVNALITIDPIDWDLCDDTTFQPPATQIADCAQSALVRTVDPSVHKAQDFIQEEGERFPILGLVPITGYNLGGVIPIVIRNTTHSRVDNDPVVHTQIIRFIASLP